MSPRNFYAVGVCVLIAGLLSSCTGIQTALDPAGTAAQAIHRIWQLLFWVCATVWLLVMLVLLWAMRHRHGSHELSAAIEPRPDAPTERRMARVVGVAVAATVVTLVVLTVVSYSA
jgi:cytochrome c oxidase subunit 2